MVEPATSADPNSYAFVILPNGDYLQFYQSGTAWIGRRDKTGTLTQLTNNGALTGWQFIASDDAIYQYDANGVWTSLDRHGQKTLLHYSDSSTPSSVAPKPGLLIEVDDPHGRPLNFFYDAQAYLVRVVDASGATFAYRYSFRVVAGNTENQGLLEFVDKPGGVTRQYVYDDPTHVAANVPNHQLLTGIVDENNQQFATYEYDASGRAYHEYHGSGGNADSTTFSYNSNGYNGANSSTIQTTPSGGFENRKFTNVAGIMRDAGVDRCKDATCTTVLASSSKNYDANGNPNLDTDFNGNVTQHSYNTRGLEETRVEAVGKSEQRTITTQWNLNFNVPDLRSVNIPDQQHSVAGITVSLTKWKYNTRGQVWYRCEIDPNPALGVTGYTCGSQANAPTGVRQWTYTYCELADLNAHTCPLIGLTKSVDGPRTDVSDLTTYTYYQTPDLSHCTTLGGTCHQAGDLQKVTNALGQITTYVSYDKNGRVTRLQDANGTYTDMTYHPRGWLLTRTVRANADGSPNATLDAITTFGYDNVGNIKSIMQPDGTAMEYDYDDAHRLTDIYDSPNITNYATNSDHIHYTLDAAGNRTQEDTKDPGGNLKRTLSRQYDQLNHLIELLNAPNTTVPQYVQKYKNPPEDTTGTSYSDGYDGNGNAVYSVDGNGVGTEQQYDPLNRLKATLQDHAGTGATKDTTTQYAYDARDNLRSVTDPDNLVTNYTYDGLNNLTDLFSPDTGNTVAAHTSYTYDAAGNRLTQTDARGVTATYSYDALNRLIGISYPTSTLNVSYAYDQPNSTTGCATSYPVGRLTTMIDSAGTTTYCYDQRGNILSKVQITHDSSLDMVLSYQYNLADRLKQVTYPDGSVVSYGRDSVGRVNLIQYQTQSSAAKQTILSGVSYYPYGPANVLTFGNGRTLAKSYDQNYAIHSVASSNPNGLVVGATVDALGNLVNASSTVGANPPTQQYQYDPLYRLTNVQNGSAASLESFTYDLTGDRLSKTLQGQAAQSYTYTAGTHHLATVAGASRSYDADGNTTGLNGAALAYDDRNRLSFAGAGNVSFDYNGRGERVMKTLPKPSGAVGPPSIAFQYLESGALAAEYSSYWQCVNGTPASSVKPKPGVIVPPPTCMNGWTPEQFWNLNATYVYLDSQPIAYVKGGQIYYIETDQLGTPRQVIQPGSTTAGDTTVWKWDYFANNSAFGENAPSVQTITFNLRFPGQYFDAETGLVHNGARDYEPGTGRYVESDPIGLSGGINTYGYVGQNPLRYSDPSGMFWDQTGQYLKVCTGTAVGVGTLVVTGVVLLVTPNSTGGCDQPSPPPDNQCPNNNDRCREIYAVINELLAEVKQRYWEMRQDQYDLYNNRPTGKMSWAGHQQQFQQVQAALRAALEEADMMGCHDYPSDAWSWATKPPPSQPGPKQ